MKTEALLLTGLLVVSIAPCQTKSKSKTPIFADPHVDFSLIDTLDLYVVNLTKLKDDGPFNMVGYALLGAEEGLETRKYKFAMLVPQITPSEAMLSNPTTQWLQDVGDQTNVRHRKEKEFRLEHVQTHRWVMIISIDEVPSKPQDLIKGTMSSSLYLYDRSKATLLWHDHVETLVNAGILGNIIETKSNIKNNEAKLMATEMVLKLPKHKKR